MVKTYLQKMARDAESSSLSNLFTLLERRPNGNLLDCGCGDGLLTLEVAKLVGTKKIWGIELWEKRAKEAKERGIRVIQVDLNERMPFESKKFDVIFANQIIEHIYNIDNFLEEVRRVLKPNGYIIISTPNLAGWQEVFSLIIGYQPFWLTNVIREIGKLNPIRLRESEEIEMFPHVRVFTFHGFLVLLKAYGFKIERALGGYYPFFGFLARVLEKIDLRHATFMTIKLKKND